MQPLPSTFLLRHSSKVTLVVLLLAIVLPVSALAQSSPEVGNKQVFLPVVAAGQSAEQSVQAAAATDLFFSEYIEGSSNNKALEIYNGTGATVDLAGNSYNIQMYFNGAATASLTINLTGTVASSDVYVLAQSSANATILAQADQTNGSGWFNGDDAVVLRKGTNVLDVIGQIGLDPGTEWGAGLTSTADNTIRRKATICTGDTNGSDAFEPAVEWDGFATDAFDGLGTHSASCGSVTDSAPTVSSTSPANNATDVAATSDITLVFSEAVNVSGDWYTISCTSGPHTATVSGGPTTFTLNPDTDFAAGDSCTVTINAANVTDQDGNDPPDAMAENYSFNFSVVAVDPCTLTFTPIYAIQGSGLAAAITGTVTTKGVVVGDYEGPSPTLRGFYLQDAAGDNDPATSDGIFVFNGNNNSVSLGDIVRVTGSATEFQDQTQINASTLVKCGTGSVDPVDVTLPFPSATYPERYEGMLVRLPQTLYVSEHFQLGRFGQVLLSSGGRLQQPTNVVAPGAAALALQAQNDLNQIILDDALQNQNPDPILFGRNGNPLSASNTLRGGDNVTNIVGLMTYTWAGNSASGNAYRVRPINALGATLPDFQPANPRPMSPPAVGGSLKVTGMNLLNFFNTFGTGACTNGVGGAATDCRGADDAGEFARQWPKTVAAIVAMNPDVLGVNELENDGYGPTSALQFLVDQLNAATAPGTYAFIDVDAATGQVNDMGMDAIKVALLYKPAVVTPVGQTAALNTEAFVNGGDSAPRNRASVAQAFRQNATGAIFIININHLKSKGSACDAPDAGDGQGNCNGVRVNAVNELLNWFATDPTGTGDPDILMIGDYNSYAMEDPITTLLGGGFTNLVSTFIGPDAYSYVFDGQWGYLDQALGSPSIVAQVAGVGDNHINADEPSVLDYNDDFKSAGQLVSLYAPDQFRVSDHDPVLVGLDLDGAAPVAAPTQSPAANGAGWNNSDVTVTWNWSDNGAGIDTPNCTTSSTSSGEGELTLTATCRDKAGNTGSASYSVKVDKVAPTVTVTGVSNGASYTYGSVPSASCNTQDATSGVASAATISVTGGNIDGIGNFTATCSSATDKAGNSSTPVSVSYTVLPPGTVLESCGGYTIYRNGSSYVVPRWSGAILVGTSGNNTLNGGNGPDLILGLGGNDLINGNGGNDVICGDNGVDLLFGLDGNDFLDGGAGNDVLNGGNGDYDHLVAGADNDTLLDGDGVLTAQGGTGNDLFTIVLRNGWRNSSGQTNFAGLAAGYGNDTVGLIILDPAQFLIDITGDELDTPPSSQEGKSDRLVLTGNIAPASTIIKFEQRLILLTAETHQLPRELDGAEYLSEPVGEDGAEASLQLRMFLPLLTR
ncbi:MAG: ExeM/NucH family extracellular endonuclease [Caldilineaceae bacterium]